MALLGLLGDNEWMFCPKTKPQPLYTSTVQCLGSYRAVMQLTDRCPACLEELQSQPLSMPQDSDSAWIHASFTGGRLR